MINVTRSFLPDIELYISYLRRIWDNGQLTNQGPLSLELETQLRERLNVPYFLFLGNGTIALQLAIKALKLKGEIITTPFSYVATTTAVLWENCRPIFVDIEPDYLCINPEKIEAAITPSTTAILATHVFGNPCDVEAIKVIADKHNLKVIYDGAHAFGVKYKGRSIYNFGDVSTLSFHATKLFHTAEGGGIAVSDLKLYESLKLLRSFGHIGDEYYTIGINGKNSELHAAMGLSVLPSIVEIINGRKDICEHYDCLLNRELLVTLNIRPDTIYNYSYYPVVFPSEQLLLKAKNDLLAAEINPRRYFYPSLNKLPYVNGAFCPVSEDLSKRIMCLPLFSELDLASVSLISDKVNKSLL